MSHVWRASSVALFSQRSSSTVAGGSTNNSLADLVVRSVRTDASDLRMPESTRNPPSPFLAHSFDPKQMSTQSKCEFSVALFSNTDISMNIVPLSSNMNVLCASIVPMCPSHSVIEQFYASGWRTSFIKANHSTSWWTLSRADVWKLNTTTGGTVFQSFCGPSITTSTSLRPRNGKFSG